MLSGAGPLQPHDRLHGQPLVAKRHLGYAQGAEFADGHLAAPAVGDVDAFERLAVTQVLLRCGLAVVVPSVCRCQCQVLPLLVKDVIQLPAATGAAEAFSGGFRPGIRTVVYDVVVACNAAERGQRLVNEVIDCLLGAITFARTVPSNTATNTELWVRTLTGQPNNRRALILRCRHT